MTKKEKDIVSNIAVKAFNGHHALIKLKVEELTIRNIVDIVTSEHPVEELIKTLQDLKAGQSITLYNYYAERISDQMKTEYDSNVSSGEVMSVLRSLIHENTSEFDCIIKSLKSKTLMRA